MYPGLELAPLSGGANRSLHDRRLVTDEVAITIPNRRSSRARRESVKRVPNYLEGLLGADLKDEDCEDIDDSDYDPNVDAVSKSKELDEFWSGEDDEADDIPGTIEIKKDVDLILDHGSNPNVSEEVDFYGASDHEDNVNVEGQPHIGERLDIGVTPTSDEAFISNQSGNHNSSRDHRVGRDIGLSGTMRRLSKLSVYKSEEDEAEGKKRGERMLNRTGQQDGGETVENFNGLPPTDTGIGKWRKHA